MVDTFGIGFASFFPVANGGPISGGHYSYYGFNQGDKIIQVIDLVTGVDVTTNFDSFVGIASQNRYQSPYGISNVTPNGITSGVAYQLNTTPNSSHCHLALLQRANTTPHNYKIGVANTINGGTPFSGLAINNNIVTGDILIQALSQISMNYVGGNPYTNALIDMTFDFAPTVQSNGEIFQIMPTPVVPTDQSVTSLFLFQSSEYVNPEFIMFHAYKGSTSLMTLPQSSYSIKQVLDITLGQDITACVPNTYISNSSPGYMINYINNAANSANSIILTIITPNDVVINGIQQ